ncbi:MLO-like protein [Striga asiatica]|uniref:MLO-like protein n=1 Tax=Striga asiatica TaxID=4170 RepID=A0A5A7PQA0_STRAF|nr:MLO-like protein [Striga asiatica]
MRSWKSWEKETRTTEYQFSNDPERFRFARETSFGRRHLNFWSKTPVLIWIIILLVGTKLQVIITRMGLKIQERGEVVKGVPVVQPGDYLFWFNRPRLILYLINFVLFQNAFQLAFFSWTVYEFGLKSCFHEHVEDVVIRITMGILVQILCSYVTLPLYALVTQMGSTMKPTIFNERVATALKNWHHTAKKHVKEINKHQHPSAPGTPMSGTPRSHGMSPVHLLRNHKGEADSFQASPRRSNFFVETDQMWDSESPSPHGHPDLDHEDAFRRHPDNDDELGPSLAPAPVPQLEINVTGSTDFSFDGQLRK